MAPSLSHCNISNNGQIEEKLHFQAVLDCYVPVETSLLMQIEFLIDSSFSCVFHVTQCFLYSASEAMLQNKRGQTYICISRVGQSNSELKSKRANAEVLKYGSEFTHPSKKEEGRDRLPFSVGPDLMFVSHGQGQGSSQWKCCSDAPGVFALQKLVAFIHGTKKKKKA